MTKYDIDLELEEIAAKNVLTPKDAAIVREHPVLSDYILYFNELFFGNGAVIEKVTHPSNSTEHGGLLFRDTITNKDMFVTIRKNDYPEHNGYSSETDSLLSILPALGFVYAKKEMAQYDAALEGMTTMGKTNYTMERWPLLDKDSAQLLSQNTFLASFMTASARGLYFGRSPISQIATRGNTKDAFSLTVTEGAMSVSSAVVDNEGRCDVSLGTDACEALQWSFYHMRNIAKGFGLESVRPAFKNKSTCLQDLAKK